MANEDVIGITVNGESVATFYVPEIGYAVKLDEYQFTHVGGIHEFSVALVKDNTSGKELSITDKVVALEIMKEESADFSATQISKEDAPTSVEIVPIAEPAKKPRKPREPKVKSPEEIPVAPVVEAPRAPEPVVEASSTHEPISSKEANEFPPVPGDVDTARLPYLTKMIKFYCTAKGLKKEDVTRYLLKKEAFDMVEKDNDATIFAAIDSYQRTA
jgi:hypothetical protein